VRAGQEPSPSLPTKAWAEVRNVSGLSTGEGIISHVRDQVVKWDPKEGRNEVVDPGVMDKRLMIEENEFCGPLSVMERSGNTLSVVVRNAWDGRKLQTLTKTVPQTATGAHVSIIGHITEDEIRRRLTRTDMANGFANRFLFCSARRQKLLPHGGSLDDATILALGERLRKAVEWARTQGRIKMTDEAAAVWTATYEDLSAERPGLVGSIVARSEAQCIRLSMLYALLDMKGQIDTPHLEAAFAAWDYCEQSATWIFGDVTGDPVADEIQEALRNHPNGMTRTDIRDLFQRNRTSAQIDAALTSLAAAGKAEMKKTQTGGRPTETWFATSNPNRGENQNDG
jgi:hypothetical protein